MAKKKEEAKEPVVSSIPIPPSESALIIDLPDGQKLLVGKIETGTVIEVATWRGTGRPDSRTNRLMLGVSSESDVPATNPNEVAKNSISEEIPLPQKILYLLTKYLKQFLILVKKTSIYIVGKIRKVDLKNLKAPNYKFLKLKFPRSNTGTIESSEAKNALKIEEDFDVDFQRILDEVSQRRSGTKSKTATSNSVMVKKASQKSRKPKPDGKKSSKSPR